MPASGRNSQWSGVSFTPNGGSAVPITGVEDIPIRRGGTELLHSADAAEGPTHKKVVDKRREASIQGAKLNVLAAIPEGIFGTLQATHNDAYNGVGSGALTFILSNCSMHNHNTGGAHNTYGRGGLNFSAVWADGTTDPLAIVETP